MHTFVSLGYYWGDYFVLFACQHIHSFILLSARSNASGGGDGGGAMPHRIGFAKAEKNTNIEKYFLLIVIHCCPKSLNLLIKYMYQKYHFGPASTPRIHRYGVLNVPVSRAPRIHLAS